MKKSLSTTLTLMIWGMLLTLICFGIMNLKQQVRM